MKTGAGGAGPGRGGRGASAPCGQGQPHPGLFCIQPGRPFTISRGTLGDFYCVASQRDNSVFLY